LPTSTANWHCQPAHTLVSAARMLYTQLNLNPQETTHACRRKKQSS
jgi:hypothetical protein